MIRIQFPENIDETHQGLVGYQPIKMAPLQIEVIKGGLQLIMPIKELLKARIHAAHMRKATHYPCGSIHFSGDLGL